MKKTIATILVLSLFALFLGGCEQKTITPTDTPKAQEQQFEAFEGVKKFSSVKELQDFLKEQQANQGANYYGGFADGMMVKRSMAMEESAAPSAAPMAADMDSSQGAGASDYSQTNVQVEGVDEADFVKNDGKYIYMVIQQKLVIVDAYPADDAKIVSETDFKGQPFELFVKGDNLVIFVHGQDESLYLPQYEIMPYPRYTPQTHAYVYDISDRKNPDLIKDYHLNGEYFDSRMIGDTVYFVVKDYVNFYGGVVDAPMIKEDSKIAVQPEIFYFDNPEGNYVFHTIASFNIASPASIDAKTFMLGYSNTMYVSEDNIYITYPKNVPYTWWERHNEDRFYDVVVPLLPSNIQSEINAIKSSEGNSYEKWTKISVVLQNMYNDMEEKEKQNLIDKMSKAIEEYEAKQEAERRKTIIHRISIDDGDIQYESQGEVPGHVLNQFSLDENKGNLRIATTTYVWARDSTMYNNVFVLDPDMGIIGKLEDIAPEERIYSTRFIGDRLYMVTFKNIDPFFVIDLSDPTRPEILGELKIPGFSDYLHPYDENHIIGIGKETAGNEWGGVSTQGVKLALFDVSDVSDPKQLDKYEIGESGTDSEALHEHKAFLFDREKNLLVIPVREVTGRMYDSKYGYYRNNIWQGVYVFDLSADDGFSLKGKIAHEPNAKDDYYYESPSAVRRSLYMDDVLYTISNKYIMMNDLDDLDDINEVELPYKLPDYYYSQPMPFPGRPIHVDIDGGIGSSVAQESVSVPVSVED